MRIEALSSSSADLPFEPARIAEEADRLKEARKLYLLALPAQTIAQRLGSVAAQWLHPDYSPRQQAVQQLAARAGLAEAMVALGLDRAFSQLLPPKLEELANEELGDIRALDGFFPCGRARRSRRASGPALLTHVLAGSIVTPGLWSICVGLLIKSANLVKCSSQDPDFFKLFAESLRQAAPDLAECVSICHWGREDTALTQAALHEADAVVAYGDDETIRTLQGMTLPPRRFIGHGHRVSLAVVGQEAFTPAVAEALSSDVAFFDQQGCLSPHVVFLIGDGVECTQFCQRLAQAMERTESLLPRRGLSVSEALAIQQARAAAQLRKAAGERVELWASSNSTAWTLIYDEQPLFEPSCLNRVLRAKRLVKPDLLPDSLRPVWGRVQAIAAAPEDLARSSADLVCGCGVSRICAPGQLQDPPLSWPADASPVLSPLVHWMEEEA